MNEHRHYQFVRGTRSLTLKDHENIKELNQYSDVVLAATGDNIEIDLKLFFDYFEQNKKEIYTFNGSKLWRGIQPISGPHINSPYYKINKEFFDLFPNLSEQMKDIFPFKEIHTFHFWEQVGDTPAHQDGGVADLAYHFPWSYRIILMDHYEPSFFVHPLKQKNLLPYQKGVEYLRPVIDTQKHYLKLPPDSNVFCFNNSGCLHGSDKPKVRKVIGFLDAEIDFEKHLKILKKSTENYSDFVIRKENFL